MHPSIENVKKALELTKGGVIQKGSDSVDHPCRACNVANSIRKVSRDPQIRHVRVFELVYVDVEKITPIGYNGHVWASLFTEDASSKSPIQAGTVTWKLRVLDSRYQRCLLLDRSAFVLLFLIPSRTPIGQVRARYISYADQLQAVGAQAIIGVLIVDARHIYQ